VPKKPKSKCVVCKIALEKGKEYIWIEASGRPSKPHCEDCYMEVVDAWVDEVD